VPGTFNHKIKDRPRPVRILSLDPTRPRFSMEWWSANLPVIPDLRIATPAPRPRSTSEVPRWALCWAEEQAPEGGRHGEMVRVAKRLKSDAGLSAHVILPLLRRKAAVSPGTRQIGDAELEAIVQWA
jgi:hypothetical protein